ncbi:MAG: sulfurtransferase [Comamonadaceae bacterium]|nr:sulfurtransferase [Comamonadaceae bacterium]
MTHRTLIDAATLLAARTAGEPLVLLECSFDLTDTAAGERTYHAGHLPDAQYAHLDRDLAGTRNGHNGRHPLPERAAFARRAGEWGIAPGVQVVAYDRQGGPYAARAWWLLRWLGHEAAAVLDGGVAAFVAAGGQLVTQPPRVRPEPPYPVFAPAMPTIGSTELLAQLAATTLLDARAGERFRGDVEPLDPVAGHIPGARHRFFQENLQADGCFKPAAQLRREFAACAAAPGAVVHQCGSGVTACHNLLAMEHAGLPGSRLYPGSWSEWCSDPTRPVASA